MKTWFQVVLFVVVIITTSTKECSDFCICMSTHVMDCSNMGLSQPSPGYWPEVSSLDLSYNNISVLQKYAFIGFPQLRRLQLQNNALTEFNMELLAPLSLLESLYLEDNRINSLSVSSRVRLKRLVQITLKYNNLSSLDPDVFSAAPNLEYLVLSHNPIIVQTGQLLLNHASLKALYLDGLPAMGVVEATMFSGLPLLETLYLSNSGITDIAGAFVNNIVLKLAALYENNITAISEETFATNSTLQYLTLRNNPLERLDIAALDSSMTPGGYLVLDATPLGCECANRDIYRWAQKSNVIVSSVCPYTHEGCSFD